MLVGLKCNLGQIKSLLSHISWDHPTVQYITHYCLSPTSTVHLTGRSKTQGANQLRQLILLPPKTPPRRPKSVIIFLFLQARRIGSNSSLAEVEHLRSFVVFVSLSILVIRENLVRLASALERDRNGPESASRVGGGRLKVISVKLDISAQSNLLLV